MKKGREKTEGLPRQLLFYLTKQRLVFYQDKSKRSVEAMR